MILSIPCHRGMIQSLGNEGIILKSLLEERKDKTIVLVSHRKSTMSIVDEVTQM